MTRKIARQSEATPSKTIDEYLWNERLGVAQLPEVMPGTTPAPTSSLPPEASAAPVIDFGANAGTPSDMFGSGVSGAGTLIKPQTAPASVTPSAPAVSKAAAISTLYGDVNPTPTIGDTGSGGNGGGNPNDPQPEPTPETPQPPKAVPDAAPAEDAAASALSDVGEVAGLAALASKRWISSVLDVANGAQINRNDSSEKLPNGPDAGGASTIAPTQEGGSQLTTDLGERASLAFANKSGKDNKMKKWAKRLGENVKTAKYHYIRKEGDQWCIWQKKTGKTLSCHDSKKKAEKAFRAMEMSKHG